MPYSNPTRPTGISLPPGVEQAIGSQDPAQCQQALAQWGWTLLYMPAREALENLIGCAAAAGEREVMPYRLGILLEHDCLPHEATRRLACESLAPPVIVSWMRSRAEQQFDDFFAAVQHAEAVIDALNNDRHPLTVACVFSKGLSLVELARPHEAVPLLQHALRAARRDGLRLLELQCARALVLANQDIGDTPMSDTMLDFSLSRMDGLQWTPGARPLRRLAVSTALCNLEMDEADGHLAAMPRPSGYWSFPCEVLHSLSDLVHGRTVPALARWRALEARDSADFHCIRWRADLGYLRVWCLGVLGDRHGLERLAHSYAMPADDAGISELREATHALAADLLIDGRGVAEHAGPLARQLTLRGLPRLAARVRLLMALADPAGDGLPLALEESADGGLLDALWLGAKAAPLLQRLLKSTRSAHWPAARSLATQVMQFLLAPTQDDFERSDAVPPAGLTRKEWSVLMAISQGLTNDQIASRMSVASATVKTHINNIYTKLRIGSREEAKVRGSQLRGLRQADIG